jgi:dinuclear metal center YbgI/SA1388 family protein
MIKNIQLLFQLNKLLSPEQFKDYCPNGLQVEGVPIINKIITGVSLSQQLIDIAIEEEAQAIIVHHGIFWHKEDYSLTGIKRERIARLINHGINLFAYHIPLDNHPTLGNNVQLAKLLDIAPLGQADSQDLLWYGELKHTATLKQFAQSIKHKLGREPLCFGAKDGQEAKPIKSIAWCTGAAQGLFNHAINLGVDAYLTGEVSEPVMNLAAESGVVFIAAGHYATERYGIKALSAYIDEVIGVPSKFIELYNPI